MNKNNLPAYRVILVVPRKGRKADHLDKFFKKYPGMQDFALFRVITPTANLMRHISRRYKKVYYFKSISNQLDIKPVRTFVQNHYKGGDCIPVSL